MDGMKINFCNFERMTAMNTNPGYSLMRLLLRKIRIIIIYFFHSFKYFGSIQKAKVNNRKIYSSKKGKDVLIIAGGPSSGLLNVDAVLEDQKNHTLDVIAMNWYTNTELSKIVIPNYYVLSDPKTLPNGEGFKDRKSSEIWDRLDQWPKTQLIIPNFWYSQMQKTKSNVLCYIDERELLGFSQSVSICKPRGYCSMTALKSIAAAMYLGYEKIYLIGFDSTTFQATVVDSKNNVFESKNNLADSQSTPMVQLNSYFTNGMADVLYAYSQVFNDLRLCFSKGPIVNIQSESFIDCFGKSETRYLNWC